MARHKAKGTANSQAMCMMVSYTWICIFLGVCIVQLCAFSPTSKPSTSRLVPPSLVASLRASSHDELASTFPRELPAGMRGEAVRSALRSPNGVCIDYTSNNQFGIGVVKVDGVGVQSFLEGKLSNSFDLGADAASTTKSDASRGKLVDSCLLTSRGRTVDRISVALFAGPNSDEGDDDASSSAAAYLLTSPGHAGSALFRRLDPYVFPMDGVKLTDMMDTSSKISTRIITVAATKLSHAREMVERYVAPKVAAKLDLPKRGDCTRISADGSGIKVIILPYTFLPDCVCVGYTFVISESSDGCATAQRIWDSLISEIDDQAPVELGPLEWETLRIEGGWPAYGHEMTGDVDTEKDKDATADGGGEDSMIGGVGAKASPLELHLESAVDETKGCYLGQEAISALLKNKRGVPRSLYSVAFNDEVIAETRVPLPGDDLYVLGSAEKIKAGMITSVAEPDGSGDPTTLCLALIRRSDSILSKMETMGLELGGGINTEAQGPGSTSVPPPVDPLDGLEVIIAGTNAIGKLQSLPCRRFRNGLNMFDAEVEAFAEAERDSGAVMGIVDDSSRADVSEFVPEGWDAVADEKSVDVEDELRQAEEEAAKAAAEAEAAAAEAKRKAEKMEMLKKKAEEAMARRRKKKKKT